MSEVVPSKEVNNWTRKGVQMIQDEATKPLHLEIETLRAMIRGLHKQSCICWVCEKRSADETPQTSSNLKTRLARDIYDDGADHHPPGYFGRKGDEVVIHSVQSAIVSHVGREPGFTVHDGDLELTQPVETTEHRDTARLNWLADTVLCADYGDNNHPGGLIGWRVMEFIAPVIYGKTLEEAIDAGMADEFHRRRQRSVKPTIESLEKLLQSEDATPVQILPDGSVRPVEPPAERMCKHDDGDCHKDDPCETCPVYRRSEKASACHCDRESALDCASGTAYEICKCKCHAENGGENHG